MNSPNFVVRPALGNLGGEVRFFHDGMGDMPVGPRLAKGSVYPTEIGTHFDFKGDAEDACKSWAKWYDDQPYLKKKTKAKYLA